MGRGKKLTSEEMIRIKTLKEEHYPLREIARRLGRSHHVIMKYLEEPENYGKRYKGRTKRATTERERRRILREASNSSLTAGQIALKVGTQASVRTVRRIINKCSTIKRLKIKKRPALNRRHYSLRLEFARQHMTWKLEWYKVIFTDEKKFNLDGPDGYAYYFHDLRKEERYLSRRHSALGSIMVWGAICCEGVLDLVVLEGKQSAEKYIKLLEQQKIIIKSKLEDRHFIFQHDNAPIHSATLVKKWFTDNNIENLEWPSVSPDLNIMENVWGWLTRKLYADGRQFDNKEALKLALMKEWSAIPRHYIQSLYDSMPSRLFEVIRNNGKNTKY